MKCSSFKTTITQVTNKRANTGTHHTHLHHPHCSRDWLPQRGIWPKLESQLRELVLHFSRQMPLFCYEPRISQPLHYWHLSWIILSSRAAARAPPDVKQHPSPLPTRRQKQSPPNLPSPPTLEQKKSPDIAISPDTPWGEEANCPGW